MWELSNQYGINIKHTAAYSPWSNQLNEYNDATTDIIMKKCFQICLMLKKMQLFSMLYLYLYAFIFTPISY